MNIKSICEDVFGTSAINSGTVHNGGKDFGIRFYLEDGSVLIVNLPTNRALELAKLIESSVERGKIV